MDFGVDTLVGGVVEKDGFESDDVKYGEHGYWTVREEVGEDRLRNGEVKVRNFQRLGVD